MVDPDLAHNTNACKGSTKGGSRRVLVVGPSWVGDMVMAQSLFKALSCTQGIEIDVLAPPGGVPLLNRMPEVHSAITAPFRHGSLQLRQRRLLSKELAQRRYSQAIVLPNSLKSALIPYWAGIPVRTGYLGEQRWGLLNDIRKLDKAKAATTVQRFSDLALEGDGTAGEVIHPKLDSSSSSRASTMRDLGISVSGDPVLALCPGAEFGPAKRWPSEHFASVADTKIRQGWQVWLVGSTSDKPIARDINQRCQDHCIDLTGKTELDQVVDLLAAATCVVSNDSGLMHIAAAVDRPLVAIFGSSDPKHTPPLSPYSEVAYLGLECSPCFKRQCPLKHLNCLNQLTPDRITTRVEQILERTR